ncbi:MutS-related protein [Mucilaginibacter psychrotolerans]|uniref:DNA mismatch repair protein MutS n=1 Tax=Mucilaginibacter psychrotolerans TaxID=1524096 RepID=A0A4Y8S5J9_9SPHI|nr:DNA mismatch repair protein MutS [Mucilaginibacter psychrotolerans]TFF33921.1 DNA mismatch repair protein MutS [Mucilaginibacter psychrotolerans]
MERDILNDYTQAAALAAKQAGINRQKANTYSLLRLGIFGLMIFSVYLTISLDSFGIMAIAMVLLLLAFAWLVARQGAYERLRDYYLDLKKINDNELDSLGTGANLYSDGQQFANEKHFYASDLDIAGPASLYQLINRAATTTGNQRLAQWLLAPADKPAILQRQEAVKELAAKNEWKKELQALLLFARKDNPSRLGNLFSFLRMPLNLPGEKALGAYAKAAPYLLGVAIVAAILYPTYKGIAIFIALANLGIVFSKAAYIKKTDFVADKIGKVLSNYAGVFNKIESEPWVSTLNNGLAQKLKEDNTSQNIRQLGMLIDKLNYHLNIIVGVLLNAFFLWDIRQVIAIENWKRDNCRNIETAFDIIADFEALISIAVPAINYPDWTYPVIAETEGYTLTAKSIAHPLIRGKRVDNDYELNNAFSIDIITGSNMAGKSTFLRTVGINTVLALAGAPVCAEAMVVSVINIVSYMRIKDNLNESTSTFKAELDRLQMLLAAVENQPRVFFLIDEMLRGTNSVDKYLGSKAVIERLISKKGVGMVATHDLQIARLEDKYPSYVRNYYFDIQVIDGEMLFDYKIKHGECKTFNASLLLKQIGIDVGEE